MVYRIEVFIEDENISLVAIMPQCFSIICNGSPHWNGAPKLFIYDGDLGQPEIMAIWGGLSV